MDLNAVEIIGRLTRDFEVGYTSGGVAIGKMTLAVNHMKKDEVSFLETKVFGKLADNLKPYLLKGKQVAVSGFLKQERWEKDGQKYSRVIINADSVQLLGGNRESSDSSDEGYGYGN